MRVLHKRGAGDLLPGVWGCPPDSKVPQEWGIQGGLRKGLCNRLICYHKTGTHIASDRGGGTAKLYTRTLQPRYILSGITGNIDIKGGDVMMALHPTVRSVPEMGLHEMLSPEQQDKMIGADRFPMYSWRIFWMIETNAKKVSDRTVNGIWLVGFAHAALTFRAMIDGNPYPVKALLTIANNPLLTYPNSRRVYEALMKLDIHVAMDVFMTPTGRIADYVLPAACSFEKPFSHGVEIYPFVHGGEAAIGPLFERKPEYYFWRELGMRLGQQNYWPWKTLEKVYDWCLEPLGMTFKQFMAGDAHDAPPQMAMVFGLLPSHRQLRMYPLASESRSVTGTEFSRIKRSTGCFSMPFGGERPASGRSYLVELGLQ